MKNFLIGVSLIPVWIMGASLLLFAVIGMSINEFITAKTYGD